MVKQVGEHGYCFILYYCFIMIIVLFLTLLSCVCQLFFKIQNMVMIDDEQYNFKYIYYMYYYCTTTPTTNNNNNIFNRMV